MKKLLYISLSLLLTLSLQAQVDRSVQPKPGSAPKVNLGKPKSFELPNGLKVIVVENHKLPRVSFTLTIDNKPSLEGELKGVDNIASSMMGNGTSKISKEEFNKRTEYYGSGIYFSVHNVNGSALSRYFPEILELTAQGMLDPLFNQEELDSERAKLLDDMKANEKNIKTIASRVRRVLLYGKNHPSGEYITPESVANIKLSDVKDYYSKYCVPENAYLIIVGDVKFKDVKKLVEKNFSSWKKAQAPVSTYTEPVNIQQTQIDFIDVPTAVQSEIAICNITNLKMTDPDYFAVLMANQILGGGGDGYLFQNLRETHGWTYGSYSRISGSKYTSNFAATAAVRNAVTDSAIVEMMSEIKRIGTTEATQEALDLAKAVYIGSFVMNAEKPQTIASFALREKTQSLPADYYENYIKSINAVTLEQVKEAANKYMLHNASRIIIAGKATEVLPSLEKLGIPINYYDNYGNKVDKPILKNVDVKKVLEDYMIAVGGRKAMLEVKSIVTTATGEVQGNALTMIQKVTNDGKYYQEMQVAGQTMMKVVYNNGKGYIEAMGQKNDIPESEIKALKYNASTFSELILINEDIKYVGEEDNAYILALNNDHKYFYDKTTGLKIAEEVTKEMNDQLHTQRVNIGDYRLVNHVQIPHLLSMDIMGMKVEFRIADVKINEGVTDADFE
ncbi:insulinase family protein [Dysgonomonas sp. 216]|uniref:M16 family metallopeptidase n=1 Tax=Dysgonomonas sp. 216 TaxID=2302934 RepID=UPI0013D66AED|nr:pitrilysin family protein [Dysgonomonas sp. 216]NDW19521.1 insulinase family protein [Dysgonomonas sp. 216]